LLIRSSASVLLLCADPHARFCELEYSFPYGSNFHLSRRIFVDDIAPSGPNFGHFKSLLIPGSVNRGDTFRIFVASPHASLMAQHAGGER
jgi:hypothetical protein